MQMPYMADQAYGCHIAHMLIEIQSRLNPLLSYLSSLAKVTMIATAAAQNFEADWAQVRLCFISGFVKTTMEIRYC